MTDKTAPAAETPATPQRKPQRRLKLITAPEPDEITGWQLVAPAGDPGAEMVRSLQVAMLQTWGR